MIDYHAPGLVTAILAHLRPARLYKGQRYEGTPVVNADKRELLPDRSQVLWNHSPDGFEWGYQGSGPAQLALALLLDVGLPPPVAVELHQAFKREFVANWSMGDDWHLTGADVVAWIKAELQRRIATRSPAFEDDQAGG